MSVERDNVIAQHRAEGEPQTMARVEGMCLERWPRRVAIVWLEPDAPRRHVAVKFVRDTIEGTGATWFEAFEMVDRVRRERGIGY